MWDVDWRRISVNTEREWKTMGGGGASVTTVDLVRICMIIVQLPYGLCTLRTGGSGHNPLHKLTQINMMIIMGMLASLSYVVVHSIMHWDATSKLSYSKTYCITEPRLRFSLNGRTTNGYVPSNATVQPRGTVCMAFWLSPRPQICTKSD
jgi:L-cystine uptake protein TcyP (sodium:dicarboxylate symporter family)